MHTAIPEKKYPFNIFNDTEFEKSRRVFLLAAKCQSLVHKYGEGKKLQAAQAFDEDDEVENALFEAGELTTPIHKKSAPFQMANVFGFLAVLTILLLTVANFNCQCVSEMCEKTSLSLRANTKHNYSLDGYVIDTLSLENWQVCFNTCLKNCQCLSFNFNEVNTTENCELNDANTKLAPEALREKEGVIFYEPVRNYYDKNGVAHQTCSEPACHNECCDFVPCQHGGTCSEVCDINRRRFSCTCPPGYTGHKCQFPARACKDIMMTNTEHINGVYFIVDQHDKSFPVYCDFSSEPGVAWTLIQSHSLENNDAFSFKPFYLHDMPINQGMPEWNSYRLSMSRMKSIRDVSTHWRATCNFPTDGVDYRDYWRVSLESLDLLVEPNSTGFCLLTEFVNVRGDECYNCTVLIGYGFYGCALHMDSHFGPDQGCDFGGGIFDEDNFGFYQTQNPAFRCTSSMSSTTQFWLGSL
ncbi:uncharacterized protein LOC144659315 [Oculina patagonica]